MLIFSLPENLEAFVLSAIDSTPGGGATLSLVTSSLLPISPETLPPEEGVWSMRKGANGRGKSKSGKEIESYYCHKKGHVKKECRKLKKDKAEAGI